MSSGHSLRVYTAGDPLSDEAEALFGHEVRDAFDAAAQPMQRAPVPVVIAAGDDPWTAGVFMLVESIDDQTVGSIRQLVVRPEHRGRGLAGWLLRRAHGEAAKRGCQRVRSTAGWGCPDHLAMYDRLGYRRHREGSYLVSRTIEPDTSSD
jgi:GNAT superfamily N-acetyltransferase